MKFLYEYQDKSNRRHSGSVNAPTRAAAYAALKLQGIKPIRCEEAPGFYNLMFGKGKRWLAIAVLGGGCLLVGALYFRTSKSLTNLSSLSNLDSQTRRQLIGDAAVIEKGIRTGWAEAFDLEGERFLASFAIPGVPAGQRNTTEDEIRKALNHSQTDTPDHAYSLEVRQIRAMVEGMKDELRRFLKAGGTIAEYGQRLVARQEEELGYYNRAKHEIELAIKSDKPEDEVLSLWEKRNSSLRKMGIKLISLPDEMGGQNF